MHKIPPVRLKNYLVTVSAIVFLRALDLGITFHYTPTLSSEWNPVVSLFGAGWTGLILTQLLVIAMISGIMFFYFARKEHPVYQANLPFQDFVYVYFFDKLKPWPGRMFTFPKNAKKHLEFLGFVFMVLALFISVFAIIHNILLIAEVRWYCFFVGQHYQVYFPVIFGGATLTAAQAYFLIEYGKYKRTQFN